MSWDLSGFTGKIIVPGDQTPEFQNARRDNNLPIAKYPAAILFCLTTEDVINAVKSLRSARPRIPFRLRSGGSGHEERTFLDSGVIIDVSQLQWLEFAQTGSGPVVRVGAGLTQGQIYRQVGDLGYALAAGTAPSAGIADVALGGGFGMMTRFAGLTPDNLLQIDLVTPQGDFVTATGDDPSLAVRDLFWALRGGGAGHFGIVTGLTFKLHPIKNVTVFEMNWNFNALSPVLSHWQEWAHEVDPRLTSRITVHPAWTGKGLNAEGLFLGARNELESILDYWTGSGAPAQRSVLAMSFYESTQFFATSENLNHYSLKATGGFLYDPIPAAGLAVIRERLSSAPTADCALWMQGIGGAAAAKRPDETAFFHRDARFLCEVVSAADALPGAESSTEWVKEFRQALAPYATLIDLNLPNWQPLHYGRNLARLHRIKRTVDPDNLFRFRHTNWRQRTLGPHNLRRDHWSASSREEEIS